MIDLYDEYHYTNSAFRLVATLDVPNKCNFIGCTTPAPLDEEMCVRHGLEIRHWRWWM